MTDNLAVSGAVHDLNNHLMILLIGLERLTQLHPGEEVARKSLVAAEKCIELVNRLHPQQ